MYTAMFIFEPGEYDAEFKRLNSLIDMAANATKGFLGAESWVAREGKLCNAIYYWETLEALAEFTRHPHHLEAKRQYQRWYEGYHVVVSEVIRSYGDSAFEHATPNLRRRAGA